MQLRSNTQSQRPATSRARPQSLSSSAPAGLGNRAQQLRPRSAYLLGQGPVPPMTPAERASTNLRSALDGRHWQEQGQQGGRNNIVVDSNAMVLVRVPVDGAVSDTLVSSNITFTAFMSHVCDKMGVSSSVAKLGWKTSDDTKAALPHELQTPDQLEAAFQTVALIKKNPRRLRAIAMVIIHRNPNALSFETELRILQEKLPCATHVSSGRWCYVKPGHNNGDDHIALGIEELTLWAKKMHDGSAEATGTIPPDCFRWVTLPSATNPQPSMMLKCKYSTGSDDDCIDYHQEDLLVSSLLWSLDVRFAKINFPRYKGILQAKGLIYARSILHFEPEYYVNLGMEEGSVGILLEETERALKDRMCRARNRKWNDLRVSKGKEPV
ncbi:hypothetical protein BJ165DRAFT_1523965 [Panaeolus papilionaceus]|nr:hypothetical protein BJ165DRAFT_1523965 [Panaeolus papilionaceus]